MLTAREAYSCRTPERVRPAFMTETGLESPREWHTTALNMQGVPGSPEDTNPLMVRALRILRCADQVRLGWV